MLKKCNLANFIENITTIHIYAMVIHKDTVCVMMIVNQNNNQVERCVAAWSGS